MTVAVESWSTRTFAEARSNGVEKAIAAKLARAGYVAFAADIYGKGVRPASVKEAGELAGKTPGERLHEIRVGARQQAVHELDHAHGAAERAVHGGHF